MVDFYLRDMRVWSELCPEKCWLSNERLEGTMNAFPRAFLVSYTMGMNTDPLWFIKHFFSSKEKICRREYVAFELLSKEKSRFYIYKEFLSILEKKMVYLLVWKNIVCIYNFF